MRPVRKKMWFITTYMFPCPKYLILYIVEWNAHVHSSKFELQQWLPTEYVLCSLYFSLVISCIYSCILRKREKKAVYFPNNQLWFFSPMIGILIKLAFALFLMRVDFVLWHFWTFMWININIIEMLDFALIYLWKTTFIYFCLLCIFFEYQFCLSNCHVFLTLLLFCIVLLTTNKLFFIY